MIKLENVSKQFKTASGVVNAVNHVSLTVEEGDIFGVIGFSGAGKSTLVRCINLLERPDLGKVIVDGQNLMTLQPGELNKARKKVGMIFQHFNLMRSLTVAENIEYPLKYNRIKKEERIAKVTKLLELVGLTDKRDVYPSQLSGGQKQRVGIARALANDPSVLLCDEATSALDPQTTQSILKLLKDLNKALGITIVIITHEMDVIKTICNKAAVMDNGYVVEKGSVYDIFSKPEMSITKDFIATTSSLKKITELLESDSPVVRLKKGELLASLHYNAETTAEAVISEVSVQFNLSLNIILGDVEVIQDTPLGGLIVIINGKKEDIDAASQWITNKGITMEVLKHG